MLKGFKELAPKGNVLDLALAIMLGAALGKVVSSSVSDIVAPPIGKLLGNIDFASLFINLPDIKFPSISEAKQAGAPAIAYLFHNATFDFLVIACVLFLVVREVNRHRGAAPAPPAAKECPYCCSLIPVQASRCPQLYFNPKLKAFPS